MLIAPAILILLTFHPQADRPDPTKEELKKWKPGPRVAQELGRLEQEGRSVFQLFRNGKVAQLKVMRELARVKITIETVRAWSFANHSDEVPQIVVVIDSEEYPEIFPRGMKHLPGALVPGEIYPATPSSTRRWQYIGERRVTGMRLNIFRYASSEVGAASATPN